MIVKSNVRNTKVVPSEECVAKHHMVVISAVGHFLLQVRQPGTRCQTVSVIIA